MISDCREKNQAGSFVKLDRIQHFFLEKRHLATKIDLQDVYFQTPVGQEPEAFPAETSGGGQTLEFHSCELGNWGVGGVTTATD